MKKHKLEIIVFLSGAIGMGLELIAARVLSPYVGSSNVVWTSIIGTILASMSIGYWIGGKKADKDADIDKLSNILLLAAIFTGAIPLLETAIVKLFAGIIPNLIIAAILCAIIVFSIPSFILAMISPFAVKIKSKEDNEIGSLSGRISSLSTIGSIFGTFLMGFVLIPNIGVTNINIGVTIILVLMSFIAREKIDKKFIYTSILYICIILILVILGKWIFKLSNPDIVLDTDSQYSRIWVKQIQTQKANYKTLQVDTGLESYINQETGEMGARYLRYYDLFEYFDKDAKNTTASEIMTCNVCTCNGNDDVWDAEQKMASSQIRRIPVVDNDKVIGILTLGDLAQYNEETGEDHFCNTVEDICGCGGQTKNNC